MSLTGVYQTTKKDGSTYYRSSVTYRGKHISLGSFSEESPAHLAYLEASRILSDSSVTLQSYPGKTSPLPFEKWVCLLNYRDNRIYMSTPIYIRIKYFEYYINPDTILKFDLDDLFYYSSHKIMQRGGRFFVADYGMQVGVASRYGIKNYAVENRDYRFVNGDSLDFRYENIEIMNQYHGVSHIIKNGIPLYKAKIHINGDYIIGCYSTQEEAAIAYNKAIDILQKAGVKKKYTPNYMENMSPLHYAETYSALEISPRIRSYTVMEK